MCGIFGFITKNGHGPDPQRLREIARVTQRRGAHAFGLAWLGADNRIRTFKRPGPATDNLDDLDLCRGASIVLGHCRWATHGAPDQNANNHPHPAGRGWLVHNGVVINHRELVARYGLATQTECDSEVLGLLMAKLPGSLLRRGVLTAGASHGALAILGLWRNPARLLVLRRGKPLHFGETRQGFYFASLPQGLPGRVQAVANHYAGLLTHEGSLRIECNAIRRPQAAAA